MGSHKAAIRDLDQTFGNSQLLDIRQADIDRWFDAAQASMSPYRLRRATMMLRRVFNAAVTDGLGDGQPILPSNPCRIDTPGRDLNSRNERPLTVREARELAEAMPAHLRLVVWLGLTAGGLHMGEICALRLGDIDTEHHLIHISTRTWCANQAGRDTESRKPIDPGATPSPSPAFWDLPSYGTPKGIAQAEATSASSSRSARNGVWRIIRIPPCSKRTSGRRSRRSDGLTARIARCGPPMR